MAGKAFACSTGSYFKNERASRYRTRRLFRCILGWRNKKAFIGQDEEVNRFAKLNCTLASMGIIEECLQPDNTVC